MDTTNSPVSARQRLSGPPHSRMTHRKYFQKKPSFSLSGPLHVLPTLPPLIVLILALLAVSAQVVDSNELLISTWPAPEVNSTIAHPLRLAAGSHSDIVATAISRIVTLVPPAFLASLSHLAELTSSFFSATVLQLTPYELASVVVPVAAYWIYCSYIYFIVPRIPFLERYKLHSDEPVRLKNRVQFGEVIRAVVFQHIVQMFLATVVAVLGHDEVEGNKVEAMPVLLGKLLVGMFVLDSYEYWFHRLMHTNKYLYRNFHSVHHRLTENYSFGALYNHPVEGLLLDSVGGAVASLVAFMPPLTATIFYTLATIKTVDDHSSYIWPWMSLFFENNARYHDVHHQASGIKYNFSQPFFTFWDRVCDTRWKGNDVATTPSTKLVTGRENLDSKEINHSNLTTTEFSAAEDLPTSTGDVKLTTADAGNRLHRRQATRAISDKCLNKHQEYVARGQVDKEWYNPVAPKHKEGIFVSSVAA